MMQPREYSWRRELDKDRGDPQTTAHAYYALAVLLLAYILSFVDRNVMAVLIGSIRADFAITDFQYSLLHGFAFSMFYIVLGLPIRRFKSMGQAQRFLGAHASVHNLFNLGRHLVSANHYRNSRQRAFASWKQVVAN